MAVGGNFVRLRAIWFGVLAGGLLLCCPAMSWGQSIFGRSNGPLRSRGWCDRCQHDPCCCQSGVQIVNPDQFRVYPQQPCPPGMVQGGPVNPSANVPGASLGDQNAPGAQPSEQPPSTQPNAGMQPEASPDSFALSSGLGSGMESGAADVSTIGDFFGGGAILSGPSWNNVPIVLPLAGGDRRYKLTEHTSPMPTNRVFFDYHVFNNAVVDANNNQIDLNRYVFGLEKTFGCENFSLEVRIPIANGADSQQIQDFSETLRANEFGNISLTPKFLLYRTSDFAVSSGLGVIFPTADDSLMINSTGQTQVSIANEAYHLQPFFAIQRTPDRCRWMTFYTECDFSTGGNTVTSTNVGGPSSSELYNDQNLLFLDLAFGRWLYQSDCACNALQGIAGIFELHYTTTLNNTDSVIAGLPPGFNGVSGTNDVISNPFNRMDVLNTTAGLRFKCGENTMITIAGVAPLRGNEESLFNGEFVFQISRQR